jgi:hypothetical protein
VLEVVRKLGVVDLQKAVGAAVFVFAGGGDGELVFVTTSSPHWHHIGDDPAPRR